MEKATNCMEVIPSRGNLINEDYEFEITGKLVTLFDIPDLAEVSCKNTKYHLHIPVHLGSLSGASDICNKIEMKSIAPKVEKPQDYFEFHNSLQTLPSYRKRCWHGSRMLHWFPYIKNRMKQRCLVGRIHLMAVNLGFKVRREGVDGQNKRREIINNAQLIIWVR